jgi:PAS domain S-box-containing protein
LKKFFEILAFSPEYKKFAIIINDITEKKQTDQLIKESEERYRKLVEYSPEAIIIHNKGVIIYANPAAINGIGAQNSSQLEGKNILDFTHPGSLEAAKERIRQIYIENVDLPPVDEFNLVNFKGKVIRTEISSVALTFQGEKIVQIVIRDITDKKKIEQEIINSKEEAEEANRIKSSLLANMSHELRTPLNGILGFAQLLKDELFDSDQVNMAEKIIKSGRRLMNTLNSVLSLTELENNNYLISISEIDLPFFCAQMKLLYESAAGEKNLPVNLDLKVENLIVSTDENLLTKIIGSLMENAIKYTNKGSITIQLDRKISRNGKSVALINVIDTGIGIKQENRDIIFREFRQLSEGFRRDFEGLGLGLALVRKMVRLIGAKISLESALGIGSFFSVAIPADLTLDFTSSDQKESPEEKPGQFRKLVPSERIPDILLVEDNALNIEVVQRYLANSYKVSPANDGLTAIELARNNYFDILLIDINLGQGIDGIEVLKEIKKLKRYENVPVIALTGYASDKNKRDFLAQGFTHYLAKPFEKSELLNLLKQFLK